MSGTRYYQPTPRGLETKIAEKMRSPKPCLTFQTMQCQTVKTTAKT
ncbi:Uncharacterised protein [Vibrio cholerae]|nr:Uncharacterised protein [Vibrio cholerae]